MEIAVEGAKCSFQNLIQINMILYTNDYNILRTEGIN